MSADNWLEAARNEEQRLLDEIAKTTLYRQLAAVRAVIAVYEDTSEPSVTPVSIVASGTSARTNGSASRHNFKSANAFSDMPIASTESPA